MTSNELYKLLIGKEGTDMQSDKLRIAAEKMLDDLKTARYVPEPGRFMAYSIAVLEECIRTYKVANHIGSQVSYWRLDIRTGYRHLFTRLTHKK